MNILNAYEEGAHKAYLEYLALEGRGTVKNWSKNPIASAYAERQNQERVRKMRLATEADLIDSPARTRHRVAFDLGYALFVGGFVEHNGVRAKKSN
jgi:hypothetical protein